MNTPNLTRLLSRNLYKIYTHTHTHMETPRARSDCRKGENFYLSVLLDSDVLRRWLRHVSILLLKD